MTIANLIASTDRAFYLFDSRILRARIAYLKSLLPERVQLCYAIKANPFLTREAENAVARLEICSPGEAEICFALGVDSRKMVISGVYKTPAFIESLAANPEFRGVFTAESESQYALLCALSEKYARTLPVLARATNDSQFGMDESAIEQIVAHRSEHPRIDLLGVQFFSGTQKTSLKKLKREIERMDAFLTRLKRDYGYAAPEFEYGTGFPVSYFEGEELDEEALIRGFSEILESMENRPTITLELGRSIAASCGKYFTRVVDIKQNSGLNYLLVDGGMHHITYFGQYMAMKQPHFSVFGKEDAPKAEKWNIVGSLCSMNDILVKLAPLPEMAIGDALVFENAGAYCMTEGMSLFLSRDLPAIYIIGEDGELYCARASFETCSLNTPQYERMR